MTQTRQKEPAALWFNSSLGIKKEDLHHWTSFAAYKRFREILANLEKTIDRGEVDYTNPNWAYRQAHFNGYRKALTDIKELFNFNDPV
jgi:hypothetical protein